MTPTYVADRLMVELRFSLNEYELLMTLLDEARLMLLWQSKISLGDIDDELRYSVVERVRPLLKRIASTHHSANVQTCLRAEMMTILESTLGQDGYVLP